MMLHVCMCNPCRVAKAWRLVLYLPDLGPTSWVVSINSGGIPFVYLTWK